LLCGSLYSFVLYECIFIWIYIHICINSKKLGYLVKCQQRQNAVIRKQINQYFGIYQMLKVRHLNISWKIGTHHAFHGSNTSQKKWGQDHVYHSAASLLLLKTMCTLLGTLGTLAHLYFMMSQMFSVGKDSGQQAEQSNTWTLLL